MKYTVLHHFTDLQDDNFHYVDGATYPRKGYQPTEDRIKELSGSNNKQGVPLIKAVKEKAADDGKDNHCRRFTRTNSRRTDS